MSAGEVWGNLTPLGRPRRFAKGGRLMCQGKLGDSVMVIQTGTAKVVQRTADGEEQLIALRGRGDLLGEMSVLGGVRRNADVFAVTACTVTVIWNQHFLRCLKDLEFSRMLHKLERERRHAVEVQVAETRTMPLETRLARELLRLTTLVGSTEVKGISRALVAQRIGVSRSTLWRLLKPLAQAGIVEPGRERITVRNPEGLRVLARFDHGWPTSPM
jgi:CRP-like cAMP-binding protein